MFTTPQNIFLTSRNRMFNHTFMKPTKPKDAGIEAAREKLGSYEAITDLVGLSRQALYRWKKGIPPEHVGTISEATGIPRYVLRRDIFAPDNEAAA